MFPLDKKVLYCVHSSTKQADGVLNVKFSLLAKSKVYLGWDFFKVYIIQNHKNVYWYCGRVYSKIRSPFFITESLIVSYINDHLEYRCYFQTTLSWDWNLGNEIVHTFYTQFMVETFPKETIISGAGRWLKVLEVQVLHMLDPDFHA